MKTVTLNDLLKEMQSAEEQWSNEEKSDAKRLLTNDELKTLHRGEKVTVVRWYPPIEENGERIREYEIFRAKVTKCKHEGYTDGTGFWCHDSVAPESANYALGLFLGRSVGELIPCYTLCFKVPGGESIYHRTIMADSWRSHLHIYRGWSVEIEEG